MNLIVGAWYLIDYHATADWYGEEDECGEVRYKRYRADRASKDKSFHAVAGRILDMAGQTFNSWWLETKPDVIDKIFLHRILPPKD